MSESDVEKIREVTKYRKRKTPVNDYLNIIYKMLRDGHSPAMIYAYIYHIGYTASKDSLKNHITTQRISPASAGGGFYLSAQSEYNLQLNGSDSTNRLCLLKAEL